MRPTPLSRSRRSRLVLQSDDVIEHGRFVLHQMGRLLLSSQVPSFLSFCRFLSFSAALILFFVTHITNQSFSQLMTPRHDPLSLDDILFGNLFDRLQVQISDLPFFSRVRNYYIAFAPTLLFLLPSSTFSSPSNDSESFNFLVGCDAYWTGFRCSPYATYTLLRVCT
jgi:hypothetical protein